MIDLNVWVTLGLGLAGVSFTIVGTAIKVTWWLGARLDEITKKGDERHLENRERFARLESAILNGSGRSKR